MGEPARKAAHHSTAQYGGARRSTAQRITDRDVPQQPPPRPLRATLICAKASALEGLQEKQVAASCNST